MPYDILIPPRHQGHQDIGEMVSAAGNYKIIRMLRDCFYYGFATKLLEKLGVLGALVVHLFVSTRGGTKKNRKKNKKGKRK